jgi:hypothetical protein
LPPERVTASLSRRAGLNPTLSARARRAVAQRATDHGAGGDGCEAGQSEVGGAAASKYQSLGFAFFGRQNDAAVDCGAHAERQLDVVARQHHAALGERIGSGDGPQDLGATGADEAGDAEDLALVERERDAGHPAGGGKIFDPQQFGVSVPGVVARRWGFDFSQHRGY